VFCTVDNNILVFFIVRASYNQFIPKINQRIFEFRYICLNDENIIASYRHIYRTSCTRHRLYPRLVSELRMLEHIGTFPTKFSHRNSFTMFN